jgi:enolase
MTAPATARHLARLSGRGDRQLVLPVPSFNIINGGSHAGDSGRGRHAVIAPRFFWLA